MDNSINFSISLAAGTTDQHSYTYNYDKSGKLKTATHKERGATTWNLEVGAFDEQLTYDHNGNIQGLERYHISESSAIEVMDELTYTYDQTNVNSLQKVTDAAAAVGFDNGESGTEDDYTYDANGNLTADANKGVEAITYNYLGKPTLMTFDDGRTVAYVYDARGEKLRMSVTMDETTTVTDYIGGFVYVDETLSFFSSPEGRVVNKNAQLSDMFLHAVRHVRYGMSDYR